MKIELTFVAINGDELWLGVKGLSNLEIAGSLRKLLRWLIIFYFLRDKAYMMHKIALKLRIMRKFDNKKSLGAKV